MGLAMAVAPWFAKGNAMDCHGMPCRHGMHMQRLAMSTAAALPSKRQIA